MEKKLKKGERKRNGGYEFRKQIKGVKVNLYAKTIEELRLKEDELLKKILNKQSIEDYHLTLNKAYYRWKDIKKGLKGNTYNNYCYMYERFVLNSFGKNKVNEIKNSDVRLFYSYLFETKHLQANTIDSIHSVIHQIFNQLILDGILVYNPADKALGELKSEERKRNEELGIKKNKYLTKEQEDTLFNFMKNSDEHNRWYPIFKFIDSTGIRAGEFCALQMSDFDFINRTITISKTLQTINVVLPTGKTKTKYTISSTKTESGKRTLYLSEELESLLKQEKEIENYLCIKCNSEIGSYNDFAFLTKDGTHYKGCTLNKALARIIRDCNIYLMERNQSNKLIPHVHCHTLRHSYNTRMMEAGVPVEYRMKTLGQKDADVNMQIYTHTNYDSVKIAMEKTSSYCYNRIDDESLIDSSNYDQHCPTLAQYTA